MRILVATDQWFPDLKGGAARVASETSRRLAELGHEVTVLAPRSEHEPVECCEGLLTVRRVLTRNAIPQTIYDVIQTRMHARRLQERFDVILAHQSTTAIGLSSALGRAPLVLVYHASAVRELRFLRSRLSLGSQRLTTYFLEPPLVLLEREAVRRSARLLVLSDFSRSLLATDHPEAVGNIDTVRGGVDVETFSPADGAEAARARLGLEGIGPLLLTVRRLEPRMGFEQLLAAVTCLKRGGVSLAVVGHGSLAPSLRRLTIQLGLEEQVYFLGQLSDESLRDWYRAADLFVLPTVAYEGFGMATAEALASGTPVVGTPVGATPELLMPLDPRLLSGGSEPEALATAIDGALSLTGPELRQRSRDYACAHLAWDKVIQSWDNAIVDISTGSLRRTAPQRRLGTTTPVKRTIALVGPRPETHGGVAATLRTLAESHLAKRYRIVVVSTNRDGTRVAKILEAAGGVARLTWLAVTGRIDLVHIHASWRSASFTRKATILAVAHAAHLPVVLHVHGGAFRDGVERRGAWGHVRRRVLRYALERADTVVALTPGWAEQISSWASVRRLRIVPNSPDLAGFVEPNGAGPGEARMLLFLGHLYRDKGLYELVEAVARLRNGRPDVRLVLAGEGIEREPLRRYAEDQGLGLDAVALPGWVGPEEKTRLLAAATCFVLPSHQEGLPLALLEAMTAGVPCVATAVGGVPEVARDGVEALLVPPRDPEALTTALARILDEDGLAARLAAAGRRRVRECYSAETFLQRTESIYAELLEGE